MAHAKLIFSRHGESEWNVAGKFTGWVDVDLSEKGVGEAKGAGVLVKEAGYAFDVAYTSYLKRAIKTCDLALEHGDQLHVPVVKSWRLNERMYGGLTGLDKKETVVKHGADQVLLWRRSFDLPPPDIDEDSEYHPKREAKYKDLAAADIPKTESLKTVIERVMPFWENNIMADLKAGKTVFVCAHGNSIRAIIKYLENIPDDVIPGLEIPTGTPLVYELDADLKPIPNALAVEPLKAGKYLGDAEKIKAAAEAVKNQTKVSSSCTCQRECVCGSIGSPSVGVESKLRMATADLGSLGAKASWARTILAGDRWASSAGNQFRFINEEGKETPVASSGKKKRTFEELLGLKEEDLSDIYLVVPNQAAADMLANSEQITIDKTVRPLLTLASNCLKEDPGELAPAYKLSRVGDKLEVFVGAVPQAKFSVANNVKVMDMVLQLFQSIQEVKDIAKTENYGVIGHFAYMLANTWALDDVVYKEILDQGAWCKLKQDNGADIMPDMVPFTAVGQAYAKLGEQFKKDNANMLALDQDKVNAVLKDVGTSNVSERAE